MRAQWTQEWWIWAIRGIVAVFFGVVALIYPAPSLPLGLLLFAAYLQFDGLAVLGLAAAWGLHDRYAWPLVAAGLLGVLAGMIILLASDVSSRFFMSFLGFCCIVRGGLELFHALRFRGEPLQAWMFTLASALSMAFGAVLLLQPGLDPIALAWTFAGFVMLSGACSLGAAARTYELDSQRLTSDTSTDGWKQ